MFNSKRKQPVISNSMVFGNSFTYMTYTDFNLQLYKDETV